MSLMRLVPTPRRPPRGGRGLKCFVGIQIAVRLRSPPSRGAWIEIRTLGGMQIPMAVAPLAGGVD